MRWRGLAAMAVLVLIAPLAGCGSSGFSGLYGVALPGGADVGEHPLHLTATFSDVLDLVPQASVRVDDVPVGRVDSVDLAPDAKSAVVKLVVKGDVGLPSNAIARLRQSSLLGEKFVELAAPPSGASGKLTDNTSIPLARTARNPEVEEVLGALSLLLNGGGVDQIQTIISELNKALAGNEPQLRSLLSVTDSLATQLDASKADIVHAIDGLNQLASTYRAQTPKLNSALDNLGPGITTLAEQRGQFVDMLNSLHRLSGVTVDTVNKSKNQLVANLQSLAPVLRQLAAAGNDLPTALRMLITYPYPDYAGNDVKGDYFNVNAHLNLDLDKLLSNLTNSSQPLIDTSSILGPKPNTTQEPETVGPQTPDRAAQPASPAQPNQPGLVPGLVGGLGGVLGSVLGGR